MDIISRLALGETESTQLGTQANQEFLTQCRQVAGLRLRTGNEWHEKIKLLLLLVVICFPELTGVIGALMRWTGFEETKSSKSKIEELVEERVVERRKMVSF